MKRADWSSLGAEDKARLLERNPVWEKSLFDLCEEIFEQVKHQGDQALRALTFRFDDVDLDEFRVPPGALKEALDGLPRSVRQALERACRNIDRFHRSQIPDFQKVQVEDGVCCWREARAIPEVGLYVPGGTAPLPSTVLMLGVPARLAGCRRPVVCSPPSKDGKIAPEILAAAALLEIDEVYKVGGAQAIAALTLGTESIAKVDKILGPGNRYVQVAKMLASRHGVAIDMVAGPSEVLVVADQSSRPEWIAADLISQAEHGADSQVGLVSTSRKLIDSVVEEVDRQLKDLPRRDLAKAALAQSFVLSVLSLEEAFELVNAYAPEHLILHLSHCEEWLSRIESAGSVFLGGWTPEVAGDYASGTNHTLPTSGMARAVSGVSLDSFLKQITFQELTARGLEELGPTLEELARVEQLEGHRRAVAVRLSGSGPGGGA